MEDVHPLSPEERRKRLAQAHARWGSRLIKRLRRGPPLMVVLKRVGMGVYEDGFVHAGNIAYMSLVALFPFLILAAAVARLVGGDDDEESQFTVVNILARLPPEVRDVLARPIAEVLDGRSGSLLWFGAIVGLWTAASFIETLRDILRRAYGVKYSASFWQYRLGSMLAILAAVVLMLIAFGLTLLLTSAHQFVTAWLPFSDGVATQSGLLSHRAGGDPVRDLLHIVPGADPVALSQDRVPQVARRLAGHAVVAADGRAAAAARSALFGGYALTYGSLAGVMVALVFFFVIGLGVVTGAELNAALADPGDVALKGEHYEGPHADELDVARAGAGRSEASGKGECSMNGIMAGKRGLIMGLANDRSLAWGIAKQLREHGAELAFAYQGEALKKRVAPARRATRQRFPDRLRRQRHGRARRRLRRAARALGQSRLRRPRDRFLRQERAARRLCRHQPRQFPDDHEHLGLQLLRRRGAGADDDEARRIAPHAELLRRREGHPALQRHGRRQGRAGGERQISRRRPRPRRHARQRHQRRADQDARGERDRRLPLHHEVERI